jgi:hypothetical protein
MSIVHDENIQEEVGVPSIESISSGVQQIPWTK